MTPGTMAITVAERLLDPAIVLDAVPAGGGATLADGLPGTALLHARLSAVDPTFERAAAVHWARAAELATRSPSSGGVYHVRGGLSASLIIGSPYLPDPDTNRTAVVRAVRWNSAYAVRLSGEHDAFRQSGGRGAPWHVYDVIDGLAGTGRVLLAAATCGYTDAELGLEAALRTLTGMLAENDGHRPGWWTARDQHSPIVAERTADSGAATTGMAHGVAGPLALLASALRAGYCVPRQETAIRNAVEWLTHWRSGPGWPPEITGDELAAGCMPPRGGRNTAWCYGIPGIGRALHLAGLALDDTAMIQAARDAFTRMSHHPDIWDAEGPTLCHGHAGILRCADGEDDTVAALASQAVEREYDPSAPFAFVDQDHGQPRDDPGFLTGAAGVALALAEHADLPAAAVRTRWDALLLVS
ncbi:lanthionine synthetase C family protein [Myceligenerans halotolerans]